ncbi:MAG: glycosyltransferase [Bacteroidales bacterium]|jgi:GT2 family glycosyltransferase|nr:glycosyltransferase [Bacteroidales bacterium]
MVKLSVIIVNYNVKHFLEQCLISVFRALENISSEVFVVDNNSVDGSCSMVKERFPEVKRIENKKNHGFSYANNQAIRQARGEYILLLNPDTVVEEDTFSKCIHFMDNHADAGGLSVKMIDGKGKFLPESKRALPTPATAFYKIFGLSRLFPTSKTFARYHLGHLKNDEINPIEILPGAFMFLRKNALDKAGLLDETFFMYGEDIDLSYRITLSGYKNYYYPGTTIIHYKGESTKKGSLNYVFVFYQAMIIFARKHFSQKNAKVFSLLINLAIYFRAFLSVINRTLKSLLLPVLDILLFYAAYSTLTPLWEQFKFKGQGSYPKEFLHYIVPVYILIWILSLWFNGGYSKILKIKKIISGIVTGTIIILIFYALLPTELRFSRALIILGTLSNLVLAIAVRYSLHYLPLTHHRFFNTRKLRMIIAGLPEEIERVNHIIDQTKISPEIIGYVSPEESVRSPYDLGTLDQLEEIVKIHRIDEIVFCAKNIPANKIISTMLRISSYDIDFKIAQPETFSIIGSNSINTSGDLYAVEINSIASQNNIRNKRIFDLVASILILLISPFLLLLSKNSLNLINNSFKVLLGIKTWVGYTPDDTSRQNHLPKIKDGILSPGILFNPKGDHQTVYHHANMIYAKNYTVWNDLRILLRGINLLDRQTTAV